VKSGGIDNFHVTAGILRDQMIDEADALIRWYQDRIADLIEYVTGQRKLSEPMIEGQLVPQPGDKTARSDVAEFTARIKALTDEIDDACSTLVHRFEERIADLRVFKHSVARATEPHIGLPVLEHITEAQRADIARITTIIAPQFSPPTSKPRGWQWPWPFARAAA
jgi:hypothetical protein